MRVSQVLKNLRYPLNSEQNLILSTLSFLSASTPRAITDIVNYGKQVKSVLSHITRRPNQILPKPTVNLTMTLTVANAGGRGYDIDSETK